ncbi:(2Fe-2S) ferredoxin domain-containing protein [Hoyosella subflava]|uniref:Putative cobalamin n=1 Tax=Hoyosella subflava (strain DSM 45089 / JCM 17490 / NBRC 109087 / DQS3-9A1) TaxID=443218 RepID=F6EKB3_HOYSD|nr:(2Fe-2S) ferredoxin domain-containing protein [Hoyosella subflava]AEF42654.1 Putative cobalamin [Hoyosella subflava DQS3-9A1]
MKTDESRKRCTVLIARPTPSGVDLASLQRLAEAVGAEYALLDQGEPSIHSRLDEAATWSLAVTLVPLAVPRDRYLETWIARSVANWRETRDTRLDVTITDGVDSTSGLTAAVEHLTSQPGRAITASPRAFRSPAWSAIPEHDRHILVCRGPRCTAYGAGGVFRAVQAEFPDALVTPTGCLTPCNLGPLAVSYPTGRWHPNLTSETIRDL